ncbi:hypothetical protein LG34_00740 [Eubacterium ramulus]|jgi:N-acyl homoserine lactone hydrolase|uniref:Metallo-beta-lactamase domain-containing protein n=1 Tax=Eubacterium ramulus TaxID=39490 RepID=A0A2V1JVY1_EUBRA|nr:N-acyl homoserine lactonase family protein [Eubacterium ramulus]MBS5190687.1 N-acyl homoserine lactonase family protein [Lachnospiraceae bacterium]PWE88004.1 hypothetical protein LG34_00740 [Eubacterium ramulus]
MERKYSITVLEYAVQRGFSNTFVFSGYYGNGEQTDVTYTINVIKGEAGIIVIDTGYDDSYEEHRKLAEGMNITQYRSPAKVLRKIGIEPEDVQYVILTHAHWDHMGGVNLFPNAKFYIQSDELCNWIKTMCLPYKYNTLKVSMSNVSIENCINLIKENRLVLLDGEVDNLFPGISIRVGQMGHSFASNIVIVETAGKKYVMVGDCAYVKGNIMGGNDDGISMPNGFGIGSAYQSILTMQDILKYADGKIDNVLIGHEMGTWNQYESVCTGDGLHVAYVEK